MGTKFGIETNQSKKWQSFPRCLQDFALCWVFNFIKNYSLYSLRKQPSFFAPSLSGVSRKGRLRFTAENSILMTKICPHLVMSADWFNQ